MKESDVRALVERLFIHVAALPWRDTGFTKSEVAKQAAHDQIVDLTVTDIMALAPGGETDGQKTEDSKTAS